MALSTLNAKQWTTQPAIVVTRQQDCIHRAVGPAGVVLVGDGDPARLRTVLSAEHKRHQQVLYGIPVLTIQMGTGTDQVPMDRLARHIGRLPRSLDSVQLDEARNRLKALDAMKQRVPLPKGPLKSFFVFCIIPVLPLKNATFLPQKSNVPFFFENDSSNTYFHINSRLIECLFPLL